MKLKILFPKCSLSRPSAMSQTQDQLAEGIPGHRARSAHGRGSQCKWSPLPQDPVEDLHLQSLISCIQ